MGPIVSTLARRYAEAAEHASSERCWFGECPATLVAVCDGDIEQASARAAHYLPPTLQRLTQWAAA